MGDVINVDEISVDDAPFKNFRSEVRQCRVGHTYIARDATAICSFCSEQLRKYREFARSKGGSLISSVPDEIVFFACHRRDHAIFPLKANSIRLSPGVWCPSCNPRSRKHDFPAETIDFHQSRGRESEKRRIEARVEENRRDQARLLSSARRLYKLTMSCSNRGSPGPSTAVLDSVREQALADTTKYPEVSEVQCLLVRTILACKEKPEECWSLIASVLEQPDSASQDKLFRKAAREVHPDKCKHEESGEAFKALNALVKKNVR